VGTVSRTYNQVVKALPRILQKASPGSSEVSSLHRMRKLCTAGHAEIVAERYDEARVHFIEALNLRFYVHDPVMIDYALFSLGSTWLLTDRYREGIVLLSRYIAQSKADPGAYRERAGLFWYSGKLEAALADYSIALKDRPKDIASLSSRGQILAELGRHEEALENLDIALSELNGALAANTSWSGWYQKLKPFVHNGRGLALAGLGRIADGLAEFERSASMNAENAWVYHNRATVREKIGETEQAISDYQAALQKKQPSLSLFRMDQVRKRLGELLHRPH
jgi:tetratricopeptide (TPR) repeat protein